MMIDIETQKQIAIFLPKALEHAMKLYDELKGKIPDDNQKTELFKKPDSSEGQPEDKALRKRETKTDIEFDTYLSRLKGCLGQIELLSKMISTLSKNNMLNEVDTKRSKNALHQTEILRAAIADMSRPKNLSHDLINSSDQNAPPFHINRNDESHDNDTKEFD